MPEKIKAQVFLKDLRLDFLLSDDEMKTDLERKGFHGAIQDFQIMRQGKRSAVAASRQPDF